MNWIRALLGHYTSPGGFLKHGCAVDEILENSAVKSQEDEQVQRDPGTISSQESLKVTGFCWRKGEPADEDATSHIRG